MNDTIINNLNDYVVAEDTLFFLGDFAFGNKQEIPAIRERINCNIILILGNHDWPIKKYHYQHLFTEVYKMYSGWFYHFDECHIGSKIPCTLCHYPLAIWDRMGDGACMLYGHSHGNYQNHGRSMDVGVDTNNFKPYLSEDVIDVCLQKPIVTLDHHTKETDYG